MADKNVYRIRINNEILIVTEEIYRTYYTMNRSARTLIEKDQRNGLVSYHALDTEELQGEELVQDANAVSVEEIALEKYMHMKLHECLAGLKEKDRELLTALYFEGLSERQLSERTGVPQKTINDRKRSVLKKCKKFFGKI